jgi:hypothetical protein
MNNDTIVIADTQVDQHSPVAHLKALSQYIWRHKPAHIVHIGDHWDFPSLSHYATTAEREGRRLVDDLKSGFDAFDIIMEETRKRNSSGKKKQYKPTLDFVMGNHENRLNRFIETQPVLSGLINLTRDIEDRGWNVHQFLEPCWIDGVCYIHFMPNAMSGRAVGGGIENKLNKFPHSFVHGHQQQYQFGRRQNLEGKPHFGVCAGSFYMHDEAYRGACNTEIRGFVHLKSFENRFEWLDHDVEFVSLERLLEDY